MKIGLFTSGYQRNPLEHAFEDAKRFGYDYIELYGIRPHSYGPDLKNGDVKCIRELIDKYEMPVRGYTPEHNGYAYNFMIGNESQRTDAVEYLKLCMDVSKELGADFMMVSPGHAGYYATYEEIWNRLIKTMTELVDYADKIDQKLILEALTPMESNVCKNANDLAEIIRRVPSDNFYGMCDIVPPFVQQESIMAYFNLLGDKMYHMHIIDSDGTSDSHVMPGEGVLPLPELMFELQESKYDKTVTIELVTGYINEPRFYAKRAIENLKAMM